MGTKLDYWGYPYDDSVPAFVNISAKFWVHRYTKRLVDKAGISAAITGASYTPGAKEFGDDDQWLEEHGYAPSTGGGTVTPPAQSPITLGGITGDGTAQLDITFAGGPAASAGSIAVSGIAVDGTAIVGYAAVPYAQGDTVDQIATAVGAMLNGLQDAGMAITIASVAGGPGVSLTQTGSGGAGNFDAGASVTIT